MRAEGEMCVVIFLARFFFANKEVPMMLMMYVFLLHHTCKYVQIESNNFHSHSHSHFLFFFFLSYSTMGANLQVKGEIVEKNWIIPGISRKNYLTLMQYNRGKQSSFGAYNRKLNCPLCCRYRN